EVAGVQGADEAPRAVETVMHPTDDLLNAYADGSLDGAERADVERHLASCAACRQIVDDVREIVRETEALEHLDPPVRAWSRIERAIRFEREHAAQSTHGAAADAARGTGSEARGTGSEMRGAGSEATGGAGSESAPGLQPSATGHPRLKGSPSVT